MFEGSAIATPFAASIGRNVGGGKSYYVATAARGGLDTNEGTDPEFPLLTIAEALDKCAPRKHDYIFVQDCYTDDTFPIVVDVRDVHIIGLGNGLPWGNRTILDGAGEAAFELADSCDGAEIAGFELGSTGAGDSAIDISARCWKVHIHHCAFGYLVACEDGIGESVVAPSEDFAYSAVTDCFFGPEVGRDGIRLYAPTQAAFCRNTFRMVDGIGISIANAHNGGIIMNNRFGCKNAQTGEAILLGAGCTGVMVDGNRAMSGMLNTGWDYNPFRDLAANTVNHWGLNHRNLSPIEPVGV